MAVSSSADTNYLSSTSPHDYNSDYSVVFWTYVAAAPAASVYDWVIGTSDGNSRDGIGGDATGKWRLFVKVNGGATNAALGSTVSTNTWHKVWITRSGNTLTFYLNSAQDAQLTNSIAGRTAVQLETLLAYLDGTSVMNARVAAFKAYNALLTTDELENESMHYFPQRTANLYRWEPEVAGASAERTTDYSGNGRNWTANGTISDADGPPISW